MKSIENLIAELEHVARKNKDTFAYRIGIRPLRDGKIEYSFVCEEASDRHAFVTGYGTSVEAAIQDAHKDVPDSIEEWGYKT